MSDNLEGLLLSTLREYFGYQEFRPLQKEIVTATLKGENVLGVLETGSGKTLTFMLPAVLASKPTLVVSPTKSLIDDTMFCSQNLGLTCCKFTGEVPNDVQQQQFQEFSSYRLILATPEMLAEGADLELLEKARGTNIVERIVLDEVHTTCSWGNTFRPVYKAVAENLSKLKCAKPLLSATVPEVHQLSLQEMFGNVTILRDSVFRENVFVEVKERPTKFYDELTCFVREKAESSTVSFLMMFRRYRQSW